MSSDSVRKKIEALGTQLSLPTVRKALGALEGEHASGRRGGSGDAMDVHAYGKATNPVLSIGRSAPAKAAPWWSSASACRRHGSGC